MSKRFFEKSLKALAGQYTGEVLKGAILKKVNNLPTKKDGQDIDPKDIKAMKKEGLAFVKFFGEHSKEIITEELIDQFYEERENETPIIEMEIPSQPKETTEVTQKETFEETTEETATTEEQEESREEEFPTEKEVEKVINSIEPAGSKDGKILKKVFNTLANYGPHEKVITLSEKDEATVVKEVYLITEEELTLVFSTIKELAALVNQ